MTSSATRGLLGCNFAPERHTVWTDETGLLVLGIRQGGFGWRTDPAWEYVDRSAAIAALDRFAHLHPWERIELFGAAAAALWSGGDVDF